MLKKYLGIFSWVVLVIVLIGCSNNEEETESNPIAVDDLQVTDNLNVDIDQEQYDIDKRIAEAYAEGYILTFDKYGNETRLAIDALTTSANGGISENVEVISDSEALSYQVLVNRHFRLSDTFSPGDLSVVDVSSIMGIHMMRNTAARAAEDLFQAAYAEGGHVLIAVSGYRSYATQLSTHNHWISMMGEIEARRVSAMAGHSEHQLGLALDITTHALGDLSQQFSSTAEGQWVGQNAHRFGFIIRYPEHREADTGFIYEPWHIRFVGVEEAIAIFNSGQILEEFLGK